MKHVLSLRNTISLILALTVLASVAILPVSASSVASHVEVNNSSSLNIPLQASGWNGSAYEGLRAPFTKGTTYIITGDRTSHGGTGRHAVDIGMDRKAVLAMYGGKVLAYKPNNGLAGNELDIDHGDGYCSAYLHLQSVNVQKGQPVNQGDLIAVSGNTSSAALGYHLHIEVNRIVNGSCNTDNPSTPEVPMYFDEIPGRELNTGDRLTSQNPPDNYCIDPSQCTFSNNARARQFFDQGNERLNLEVCADNLAGKMLYVKSWRNSGFLPDQSAQAVGNCYTFLNLDGDGPAFTDVPYRAWVSIGNWPDTNWGSPCLESTFGQGMCTQAQYPSESFDPLIVDPSPEVVSIVRNDANPTEALSVDYLVTFSEESMFDVGVEDFALVTTGTISGANIVSVNPTNEREKEFIATVNTGTGDGDLRLDVKGDATITDLSEQPLANRPFTGGESYTINKIPPTVVSSIRANPSSSLTNAVSVDYTVTFSKSVTGVDTGDFTLTKTDTISGESFTVSGGPSVYTVSVNTGTGDGDLRLDLVNATITDLFGKSLTGLPYKSGESYTIDKTAPVVLSSVRVNPSPTRLPDVAFTVTFSESVTGVEINDFALAKTGTIIGESITSVSGDPSVYTVSVNTGMEEGDGGLGLYLPNGATIADIAGNLLTGLPYADGESYTVDKTPPMVKITLSNPNPTNLGGVYFNAAFSEPVTDGTFEELFVLTTTGTLKDVFFTNGGGDWTSLSVGVNTGTGDGDLCLGVSTAVTDLAGNSLTSAGTECYTVDKTAPTVVSIVRANSNPTNLASVDFTVTFSESVTGVAASEFGIIKTGTLSGLAVTGVNSGPAIYTVTINTGIGEGDLHLDLSVGATVNDLAGNPLTELPYTSGESYTVDRTKPTVVSIIPVKGDFIITFSESVMGVDTGDFTLTKTGSLIGESITGISGGPITYTISINSGTGSGDLNLNLSSVGVTINDLAGNPLTETQCNKCRNIRVYRVEFTSGGSSDGWVLESKENSNVGGSKNSDDGIIKLGDDTQNRQFRAILHFPTYYLPDNAVVTQVSLIIKKEGIVGANPFDTHGNLLVDIHNGLFANFDLLGLLGYGSLPVKNFQADADVYSVGEIKNTSFKDWYGTILDSRAYPIINLNGLTQIRLGFQLDDNNDNGDNYIRFYSGDAVDLKNRPHLQIQYYLP